MNKSSNPFERGSLTGGIFYGCLFTLMIVLCMTIGFWKTLLLTIVFGAGYIFGSNRNLSDYFKTVANRLIPEKKTNTIEIRHSDETQMDQNKDLE